MSEGGATPAPAELARQIAQPADENRYEGRLVQEAGDAGMAYAEACLATLDDAHPQRRRMVHDVLASAGRVRGWNREMLRIYDPRGFALSEPESGRAFQERVAQCLTWEAWEPTTPDALVRTAPMPTLAWLTQQAEAAQPVAARVAMVARTWGVWVRMGREQQCGGELRRAAAALLRSPAIARDGEAFKAVIRLAGEAGAVEAVDTLASFAASDARPEVRAEACAALGRIGGDKARGALLTRSAAETDAGALVKLAAALEIWPNDAAAGDALLKLFKRVPDPAVRRSVLFAAIAGRWPARPALLLMALDDEDGSVVGVALQALAAKPEPSSREAVLAIAPSFKEASAGLIDALGAYADARSSLLLASWLRQETSSPLLVKTIRALGAIRDPLARKTLLRSLDSQPHELVVEHAIQGLEAMQAKEAVPTLIALARDETAPMGVRLQAVQALGSFDLPTIRPVLAALAADVEHAFQRPAVGETPAKRRGPDRIEQARVYLALARFRLGDADAGEEFHRLFNEGSATARFYALHLLAVTHTPHPAIRQGLESSDFATLLAAILAAKANQPWDHLEQLRIIAGQPLLRALGESGVDTANLRHVLEETLAAANAHGHEGGAE
ncbi:MAG: HEAT repeat domain-containing protein [Planctomycetota bacterium]|nr:HEAT repeat domain-containing protein [Planctomycetota bacterium]